MQSSPAESDGATQRCALKIDGPCLALFFKRRRLAVFKGICRPQIDTLGFRTDRYAEVTSGNRFLRKDVDTPHAIACKLLRRPGAQNR